jgi:putative transposase
VVVVPRLGRCMQYPVPAENDVRAGQAACSPAARQLRDAALLVDIRRVHAANFGVYGARKVWHELRREGATVARCTVERLMRRAGLRGVVRGRKVRTTVADDRHERAADRVNRNFTAECPNRTWVADFTYVATWSGIVYVAFVVDMYSRVIVGWNAATNKRTSLVLGALDMGVWRRDRAGRAVGPGLVHHSDAGSQGGFNRWSQHPRARRCTWGDHRVGRRRSREGRRCGRRGVRRYGGVSIGSSSGT